MILMYFFLFVEYRVGMHHCFRLGIALLCVVILALLLMKTTTSLVLMLFLEFCQIINLEKIGLLLLRRILFQTLRTAVNIPSPSQ